MKALTILFCLALTACGGSFTEEAIMEPPEQPTKPSNEPAKGVVAKPLPKPSEAPQPVPKETFVEHPAVIPDIVATPAPIQEPKKPVHSAPFVVEESHGGTWTPHEVGVKCYVWLGNGASVIKELGGRAIGGRIILFMDYDVQLDVGDANDVTTRYELHQYRRPTEWRWIVGSCDPLDTIVYTNYFN